MVPGVAIPVPRLTVLASIVCDPAVDPDDGECAIWWADDADVFLYEDPARVGTDAAKLGVTSSLDLPYRRALEDMRTAFARGIERGKVEISTRSLVAMLDDMLAPR